MYPMSKWKYCYATGGEEKNNEKWRYKETEKNNSTGWERVRVILADAEGGEEDEEENKN